MLRVEGTLFRYTVLSQHLPHCLSSPLQVLIRGRGECSYRPQRSCVQGNIFTRVCHSFCSRGGSASVHAGIPPQTRQTPPPHRSRQHTPPDQTDPPSRHHPPGPGRHPPGPGRPPPEADTTTTPPDQADTPQTRQTTPQTRQTPPPRPGRPPPRSRHHPPPKQTPPPPQTRQTTPPGPGRHPSNQADHPPRTRQTTPSGPGRPPQPPGSRLQLTVNERPVRILLECILVLDSNLKVNILHETRIWKLPLPPQLPVGVKYTCRISARNFPTLSNK